jgi:hypothetical protein
MFASSYRQGENMKHCDHGNCNRYPLMGAYCITHWYSTQGKPMPTVAPITPGGWVDTYRQGSLAKQAAIRQVGVSADPVFKATCITLIRELCARQEELTADDVWIALERAGGTLTHEPRAMGAVMQYAARIGLIAATDRWQESALPQRHARPVRVWRAL